MKKMVNSVMASRRPRLRHVRGMLCAAGAALAVVSGCSSAQPANPGPVPTISSAAAAAEPGPSSAPTAAGTTPTITSTSTSTSTNPNVAPVASSTSRTNVPHPTKALVIVAENHSERAALEQMPYLAGLADQFGRTTAYRAVTHPSLPNYLAVAGGSTFGVSDDEPPSSHPIGQTSVLDAVIAAGGAAKTYAEDMPEPCALESIGRYAVEHNPWAYFSSSTSRDNCERFDVPAGDPENGVLRDDVDAGALPTAGLLIPDMCNDGHDCPLSTVDEWLSRWLPVIMDGPDYRAGDLAVIVTFDEDDRTADNLVLTTVIAPTVSRVVADESLTHYTLIRYLDELGGATPLGEEATAASLGTTFGL